MILRLGILPIVLLLCGCRQRTVETALEELTRKMVPREIETSKHRIRIRCLPRELLLFSNGDLDKKRPVTKALMDSLDEINGKNAGVIFALEIAPRDTATVSDFSNDVVYGDISGFGDFPSALNEYQFRLEDKIWLEKDGRKHALSTYQMENSWGLTAGRTFILCFNVDNAPEGMGLFRSDPVWHLVLDDITPGMGRKKFAWKIPVGRS